VTGVRARMGNRTFEIGAKIVIDATGYKASIVKSSKVTNGSHRFGVGAEYDLFAPEYDGSEVVLIVGGQIAPNGYAWFCPWGNKRVRAGVGVIHPDSTLNPEAFLDRLLAQAADWGVNLKGAQPIEYHYGLIPSEGMVEPFVGDGILAAGDSAGQPSQLLGEGIRWALFAGRRDGLVGRQLDTDNSARRSLVKTNAIAAGALGLVEGRIRAGDQVIGRIVFNGRGESHADGNRQ